MLRSNKKILSALLSFIVAIALVMSICCISVFAAIDDVDVYGNSIDYFLGEFIEKSLVHFYPRMQAPMENHTFVFVDWQLTEFNFMQRVCDLYEVPYNDDGLLWIVEHAGLHFLIHDGTTVYVDITQIAINQAYPPEYYRKETYDIIDAADLDCIYDDIGVKSMCALGIWQFDYSNYLFLKDLKDAWNGDFPIYVIERDPIISGPDPLLVFAFNSSTGGFGAPAGGYME